MKKEYVIAEYDLALQGIVIELNELTDSDDKRRSELNDLQDLVLGAKCTYESLYENENDLLTIMLKMVDDAKERRVKDLDDNE